MFFFSVIGAIQIRDDDDDNFSRVHQFTVHYLQRRMPACINAEACLTGWPNARVRRDGRS